ncbi:hypothetical protein [Chamaesiphon sp.]|uniref:hypothetical protein n=1 Tax=Chamaesiphon sp. TaxID=2814140 RepID=UPI0035936FC0
MVKLVWLLRGAAYSAKSLLLVNAIALVPLASPTVVSVPAPSVDTAVSNTYTRSPPYRSLNLQGESRTQYNLQTKKLPLSQ